MRGKKIDRSDKQQQVARSSRRGGLKDIPRSLTRALSGRGNLSLSLSFTHTQARTRTLSFPSSFISSERVSRALFFKKWKTERERKEEKETRTFFRRTRNALAQRERERESGKFYLSFSPMSSENVRWLRACFVPPFSFGFF